jgi:hypothetical protein
LYFIECILVLFRLFAIRSDSTSGIKN